LLNRATIQLLIDFGSGAFGNSVGTVVKTAIAVFRRDISNDYNSSYYVGKKDYQAREYLVEKVRDVSCESFLSIPTVPLMFSASDKVINFFKSDDILDSIASPRQGLASSDDGRFMRYWHEVSLDNIGFKIKSRDGANNSRKKWFPCNKGGQTRKWYGNNELVVNWGNDGEEILGYAKKLYGSPTRTIKNIPYYLDQELLGH